MRRRLRSPTRAGRSASCSAAFPAPRSRWSGTRWAAARRSYVAGYPSVQAVVALAPWIEQGDPTSQLAGRRLLIAHGTRDRITSAAASAAYAREAAARGRSVSYVRVQDDRHAMLRRARRLA